MKSSTQCTTPVLKIFSLLACLLMAGSVACAGPTNDWGLWKFKRVAFLFTNSPLLTLDGHSIPPFAESLFDDATRLYLYGEADGKVYGVGNLTMLTGNREALFNLEAKGSITTRGTAPLLSFSIAGDGVGSVNGEPGEAQLNAKFTQTRIITNGVHPFFTYVAEGKIRGEVKQDGGSTIRFEDTIAVPLDPVALHATAYLVADLVDINGRRLAGHSHGTNNVFGRYEHSPVEMTVKGRYTPKSGELSVTARGLGHAEGNIVCDITGKAQSALPGEHIHIDAVTLKGKAYGQKLNWPGIGLAVPATP